MQPQYGRTHPEPELAVALAKSSASGGGAVQNIDLNKLGGPVTVSIECIGTLTNPVVQVK